MTEYELIDLLAVLRAEVGRASMDLVTVMFGYLVCAHFIGASLSRTFVVVLTVLYSLFAFFPIFGVMTSLQHMSLVSDANTAVLQGLNPAASFEPGQLVWVVPTFGLILFCAWLMSLGYMYRVRKIAHVA